MQEAIIGRLKDVPDVQARMDAGQKFNAYPSARDSREIMIGIGPVTDFLYIASCRDPGAADLIVEALRGVTGQPTCLAPVRDSIG